MENRGAPNFNKVVVNSRNSYPKFEANTCGSFESCKNKQVKNNINNNGYKVISSHTHSLSETNE